jgi:hypothetical protein
MYTMEWLEGKEKYAKQTRVEGEKREEDKK